MYEIYTPPSYREDLPAVPSRRRAKRTYLTVKGVVSLAVCCALLGSLVTCAGMYALGRGMQTGSPTPQYEYSVNAMVLSTVLSEERQELTAAEVYQANVGSTVGITTSVTTTNSLGFQTESAASGSGFILRSDGYILTNQHVIDGAGSIRVTLYNGETYDAKLTGSDESSDIAVIKIDAEGLTPVTTGDSDALRVGDGVVAIGNPLGELTFSLTHGVISALDRTVTISQKIAMDLIQTDCAINSGNSGGPLFNMYGEVVGITSAKYSGSGSGASVDNIGFAIPINDAVAIAESIIDNGYIVKPYVGVSVSNVTTELRRYGLPQGVIIRQVVEDSPAEKAGLKADDIVTAVNGTAVTDSTAFTYIVGKAKAGDQLKLSVYRQGKTLTLTVTVSQQNKAAL